MHAQECWHAHSSDLQQPTDTHPRLSLADAGRAVLIIAWLLVCLSWAEGHRQFIPVRKTDLAGSRQSMTSSRFKVNSTVPCNRFVRAAPRSWVGGLHVCTRRA